MYMTLKKNCYEFIQSKYHYISLIMILLKSFPFSFKHLGKRFRGLIDCLVFYAASVVHVFQTII